MKPLHRIFLILVAFCIVLPLLIVVLWSVADNWRYPQLLPEAFSTRALDGVLTTQTLILTFSSLLLSCGVGLLSTAVGFFTARALVFYEFRLKKLVRFLNLLPLMIPATAFAMGAHVLFIQLGLSDTVLGVVLIHLVCGLPYSVNIMTDVSQSVGNRLQEQAMCLGANPVRAFLNTDYFALIPGFVTSFCMAYIVSFSQYFITLIIGGGAVKTLSVVMVPIIQSGDRTLSSAYGLVFMGSSLIVFFLCGWVGSRGKSIRIYG